MTTTTIKINILTECVYCDGKAYVPVGEVEDSKGEKYTRYIPCKYCEGSGLREKFINLVDFIRLMETIDIFEPDYRSLAEVEPTSEYQDSKESAGI